MSKIKNKTLLKKIFSLKNIAISGMLIAVSTCFIINKNKNVNFFTKKNKPQIQAMISAGEPAYIPSTYVNWQPQQANVCWAYSACCAMEANLRKKKHNVDLNETFLINKMDEWADWYTAYDARGVSSKELYEWYLQYQDNGVVDSTGQYYAIVNNFIDLEGVVTGPEHRNTLKEYIVNYGGIDVYTKWSSNPNSHDNNKLYTPQRYDSNDRTWCNTFRMG